MHLDRSSRQLFLFLLLLILFYVPISNGQQQGSVKHDSLTAVEEKQTKAIESKVAKRLQDLQKQAKVHVMESLAASERNSRLVCTLAWTGTLKEREGTDVGVVTFIDSTPQSNSATQKLVSFPAWRADGEYSFQRFDVAAWPMRDENHKGGFAVRIEMRIGLYWDWADSHITDDSLNKDWWKPLVAPQCSRA